MQKRFTILRDNGNGSIHVQLDVCDHGWGSVEDPATLIVDVPAEGFEKELTLICDGFCAELEQAEKEFAPVKLPLVIGETYVLGKGEWSVSDAVSVASVETEK